MAGSFVAGTTAVAASDTSLTIARPDGVLLGDTLVAVIFWDALGTDGWRYPAVGDYELAAAPAGWTQVYPFTSAKARVYVKSAYTSGGEPGSYTWTATDPGLVCGGIMAYRGVVPFSSNVVQGGGGPNAWSAPQLVLNVYSLPPDDEPTPHGSTTERAMAGSDTTMFMLFADEQVATTATPNRACTSAGSPLETMVIPFAIATGGVVEVVDEQLLGCAPWADVVYTIPAEVQDGDILVVGLTQWQGGPGGSAWAPFNGVPDGFDYTTDNWTGHFANFSNGSLPGPHLYRICSVADAGSTITWTPGSPGTKSTVNLYYGLFRGGDFLTPGFRFDGTIGSFNIHESDAVGSPYFGPAITNRIGRLGWFSGNTDVDPYAPDTWLDARPGIPLDLVGDWSVPWCNAVDVFLEAGYLQEVNSFAPPSNGGAIITEAPDLELPSLLEDNQTVGLFYYDTNVRMYAGAKVAGIAGPVEFLISGGFGGGVVPYASQVLWSSRSRLMFTNGTPGVAPDGPPLGTDDGDTSDSADPPAERAIVQEVDGEWRFVDILGVDPDSLLIDVTWDGSAWVPVPDTDTPPPTALTDLTDVDPTADAGSTGDVLTWDGSKWVAAPVPPDSDPPAGDLVALFDGGLPDSVYVDAPMDGDDPDADPNVLWTDDQLGFGLADLSGQAAVVLRRVDSEGP